MRFALIAVVTLTFVGCAENVVQPLPTAPTPFVATTPDPPPSPPAPTAPDRPARPRQLTSVWILVVDDGGRSETCIPGARVEIVRGQGSGRSLTQSTFRCESWNPDLGAFEAPYGATFDGLNVGEELTFRGSAPGYTAKEVTVIPELGWGSAAKIVLSRIHSTTDRTAPVDLRVVSGPSRF